MGYSPRGLPFPECIPTLPFAFNIQYRQVEKKYEENANEPTEGTQNEESVRVATIWGSLNETGPCIKRGIICSVQVFPASRLKVIIIVTRKQRNEWIIFRELSGSLLTCLILPVI
jgi:hypothetical protein